ncbi:MAG: cell division protein ZapA [Candidatus Puniceispirillum sp.]|nr:cell division protein ZapA [Candidatus Puniceispirillum sp.]
MTSSVVTIRLNGKPYQIGCDAGEEVHVTKLGAEVDSVMQSLVDSIGQIGEARLLAMTALIIADRSANGTEAGASSSDDAGQDAEAAAVALEKAAARLTELASKLTTP